MGETGSKVEPRFEKLNGHDALAYIVSANLARRNLTNGQQAMALAMIYPKGKKAKKYPEGTSQNNALAGRYPHSWHNQTTGCGHVRRRKTALTAASA
jgi:hypothetical protein